MSDRTNIERTGRNRDGAVRERPILFNGAMVRAILEGRKTQTRRAVKRCGLWESTGGHGLRPIPVACPYGRRGDRLWVKETWRPQVAHSCAMDTCDCGDVAITYRSDGHVAHFRDGTIPDDWTLPKAADTGNVSPLFMPRWASRILLEITDVRVERLQAITDEDAEAEGVELPVCPSSGNFLLDVTSKFAPAKYLPKQEPNVMQVRARQCGRTAEMRARLLRAHFASLWDTVNGEGAWASNTWVLVVSFRRVSQ